MQRLTFVLLALTVATAVVILATDTEARWSPADPVIAYVDHRSYDDNDLRVMDSDGSHQTAIFSFDDGRYIFQPCWSPDGKTIVFSDGTDLWTIDVEVVWGTPRGRNLTRLTDYDDGGQGRGVDNPAWSPLGDEIMYCTRPGLRRVEAIPAEGGEARILWQEGDPTKTIKRYPAEATWSPDGTLIAFKVHRYGRNTTPLLRIVDVDSGEAVDRFVFEAGDLEPCFFEWARTQDLLGCCVLDRDTGSRSLGTLDPDTAEIEVLAALGTNAAHPSWSPDDDLLLYNYIVNDPDGPDRYEIRTYDLATGDIETLCARGFDPDWAR